MVKSQITRHNKPYLDEEDEKAIAEVLRSKYIAQGPCVKAFEQAFAEYIQVPYTVAVNSGASALHLALLALGVKKDDEVIVPTYVCTALLNAIYYTGAIPVIVDISLETYSLSFEATKKNITKRTKAIIIPYMVGIVFNIEPFKKLGIPIIEDCAQVLGATAHGKKLGSFGDISIFSFYATKTITTGQGGMVASKHKKYIDYIRDLITYDCRDDYKVRYNYQMTDIAAALGVSQLKKISTFIDRRKKIALGYQQIISSCKNNLIVKDMPSPQTPDSESNYYRYIIRLKDSVEEIIPVFAKHGVEVKNFSDRYCFLHRYLKKDQKEYPNAEQIYDRLLSLPLYPALGDDEIILIQTALKKVLKNL
ncbi:DegT/DnrJ/EryC1/StrS aminotransferase family protein [Candidatus Woesearchaeota archaeon]|nr:DegT/DnrJ/EryC1/StrS aminotransferase family protein [Candidatus Woesearchaeota archaeon]